MNLKEKKIKLILIILGLCSCIILVFYHTFGKVQETKLTIDEELATDIEVAEEPVIEEELKTILVDIKGAVHKEGVYEASEGMRFKDIIEFAGGFTEDADIRQVNLAQRVEDEMVIYVPHLGENVEVASHGIVQKNDDKVSLNKATQTEFETLTGIGPSKAAAIIAYRDENGPFKRLEDLLEISGIGEKTFEKIKDELKLN